MKRSVVVGFMAFAFTLHVHAVVAQTAILREGGESLVKAAAKYFGMALRAADGLASYIISVQLILVLTPCCRRHYHSAPDSSSALRLS